MCFWPECNPLSFSTKQTLLRHTVSVHGEHIPSYGHFLVPDSYKFKNHEYSCLNCYGRFENRIGLKIHNRQEIKCEKAEYDFILKIGTTSNVFKSKSVVSESSVDSVQNTKGYFDT